MPEGPLSLYRAKRGTGTLRPDPDQALAAEKLQSLYQALRNYRPQAPSARGSWRERLGLARRPDPAPQGLYMYGGVGRGKSMLMDLFFETAPVERKRRVHFHEFMLEVHERIHQHREATRGQAKDADDAIPELARRLADEAWLLCFDEFHVTNIADAMILGRLFTSLFELGVVVVATSNWPPDQLYKDGLQRDLFLPFIALLKEKLDVLALEGPVDYRLDRLSGKPVYHWPLGPATDERMREVFAGLTDGVPACPTHLLVHGRRVDIERAAKGVAWVNFWDLCGKPFGAADYIALATHYHTVLIDEIPKMSDERRNEAKRFMTLIDELYEHKVNVVAAADAPPERLYPEGTHAFEFERTVSRLMEMQSEDYLRRQHLT
ncbi:cell division protein ZapE [Azospirillum sp. RWY-5-1]|uniref:Cell division protein ZapE n=1 Tax=Azospirillum oleiclasticum TaxID=2735135 RepID=A0ABX2TIC7_9PROT|nr:cell division protein ZapE [Azospirillum oleiclasticum]NYZ16315.1 cell division protein ZapE [Azospirillum oleiclasticum]NYZ23802.1 cell division protein ZapE [Azospirillum oleiclasticum]